MVRAREREREGGREREREREREKDRERLSNMDMVNFRLNVYIMMTGEVSKIKEIGLLRVCRCMPL